jgi:hypothetical protein
VAVGYADKQAAKRLLRKLLKKQMRPPRVMITDKLASYRVAKRDVMPGIEHRQHKGLNNRAENSHQPTRRRERQMKQFKSAGQAQRFLSAHDQINKLFHLRAITSLPPSTELPGLRHSRSGRKSAALVRDEFGMPLPNRLSVTWVCAPSTRHRAATELALSGQSDAEAGGRPRVALL